MEVFLPRWVYPIEVVWKFSCLGGVSYRGSVEVFLPKGGVSYRSSVEVFLPRWVYPIEVVWKFSCLGGCIL